MSFSVTSADFWIALGEIFGINILLSGDNAVVIALASRALPAHLQRPTAIGGSLAATVLRILFCVIVAWLLTIPYLKLGGGLALLWIGVRLLVPEDEGGDIKAKPDLWGAIMTIAIADVVMSLDNAVAIGAAAKGDMVLIVIGLVSSIPLIVFGSQLLLKILERLPILVTAGAGLLGWIAGELIAEDPAMARWTGIEAHALSLWLRPGLAVLVMAVGTLWGRQARRRPKDIVDLAEDRP